MLTGLDVSSYQGEITWHEVKAAGYAFSFIKATEGSGHMDALFPQNWERAKAVGMIRGAYHFWHPQKDSAAQASFFLKTVKEHGYGAGDLPLVIDVELRTAITKGILTTRLRKLRDAIEEEIGVSPIIYTSPYFWDDFMTHSEDFGRCPLWVSHYMNHTQPDLPCDWKHWTWWQWTFFAHVPGINGNTEADRFNGTMADLEALCLK